MDGMLMAVQGWLPFPMSHHMLGTANNNVPLFLQ